VHHQIKRVDRFLSSLHTPGVQPGDQENTDHHTTVLCKTSSVAQNLTIRRQFAKESGA
jgi:hypothetical protein